MSLPEKLVNDISDALKKTEFGYSLKLTRLVDEVSTYTLTLFDGSAPIEFSSMDEAYLYITDVRRIAQVESIFAVLESNGLAVVPFEPSDEMSNAAYDAHADYEAAGEGTWLGLNSAYRAMINEGKLELV